MAKTRTELLQGTLDLLILKSLLAGPMHGWGISIAIRERSRDVLQINQGSLYPALHRLERRKWVRTRWGTSENNRRAKYYELTDRGRRQLEAEQMSWRTFTAAVDRVLGAT